MRLRHALRLAAFVLLAGAAAPASAEPTKPGAPADTGLQPGSLPGDRIYRPAAAPRDVVILLSDAEGWSDREERVAMALRDAGAIVVGVDLPSYYAALGRLERSCIYTVSDIERLTRQLHRAEGIATYHGPVVAGIGAGGTLALAIAAQTPAATIGATVAVDPGEVVPLAKVLCTPAEKTETSGGIAYGLTKGALPNPVRVLFSSQATAAGKAHVARLAASHPDVETAEGKSSAEDLLLEAASAARDRLVRKDTPLDLPLVELPAEPKHDTLAVIYSGDGGWRDIDKKLGAYLQAEGVPVVGIDSLRYFWSERPPEETAADLSRIIATYRHRWNVRRVALIGYSFGADILPATYRRLPQADRDAVSLLSLLALSHHADFEIAVTGWLGVAGGGKFGDPAVDLRHVEPGKIQCIHGLAEKESACPTLEPLAAQGAEIVARPGGHHFDGKYQVLSDLIVARLAALRGE